MLVDGAPEVLNTLKELADAINNDANYATNMMKLIRKVITNVNLNTSDTLVIGQFADDGSMAYPCARFAPLSIDFLQRFKIYAPGVYGTPGAQPLFAVSSDGIAINAPVIGNNGFLYNKAEVDDLLDSKEPKLTAGGRGFDTNIPSGWTSGAVFDELYLGQPTEPCRQGSRSRVVFKATALMVRHPVGSFNSSTTIYRATYKPMRMPYPTATPRANRTSDTASPATRSGFPR
jgi:hypothetical protein